MGATPFIPALAGTNFGFDFNPTVDRIRVTSDAEQNLRLNPDDGAVTGVDANLAYAAGDPGAGTTPNVAGSAYTNSFAGAGSTTLFDIDNARHALVIQNPPNDGTLTTVGALGTSNDAVAFDIGEGNVGYGVLNEEQTGKASTASTSRPGTRRRRRTSSSAPTSGSSGWRPPGRSPTTTPRRTSQSPSRARSCASACSHSACGCPSRAMRRAPRPRP